MVSKLIKEIFEHPFLRTPLLEKSGGKTIGKSIKLLILLDQLSLPSFSRRDVGTTGWFK